MAWVSAVERTVREFLAVVVSAANNSIGRSASSNQYRHHTVRTAKLLPSTYQISGLIKFQRTWALGINDGNSVIPKHVTEVTVIGQSCLGENQLLQTRKLGFDACN